MASKKPQTGRKEARPEHQAGAATRYQNKAIRNVLRVLSAFSKTPQTTPSELARSLGMSNNMVARALETMLKNGLVLKGPSGRGYQLGLRVLDFADDGAGERDLRSICRPYLERLHELTGESVFLAIVVGDSRVNIDSVEVKGRPVVMQRGRAVPFHVTQTSKTLLAFLNEDQIARYIRGASFKTVLNERPVQNAKALMAELMAIRKVGYSLGRGDILKDVNYLSFPVLDADNRLHAAVTIGGDAKRFSVKRARALVPECRRIIGSLNQECQMFHANPIFV